jgi:hypothetical protein
VQLWFYKSGGLNSDLVFLTICRGMKICSFVPIKVWNKTPGRNKPHLVFRILPVSSVTEIKPPWEYLSRGMTLICISWLFSIANNYSVPKMSNYFSSLMQVCRSAKLVLFHIAHSTLQGQCLTRTWDLASNLYTDISPAFKLNKPSLMTKTNFNGTHCPLVFSGDQFKDPNNHAWYQHPWALDSLQEIM